MANTTLLLTQAHILLLHINSKYTIKPYLNTVHLAGLAFTETFCIVSPNYKTS